MQQCSALDKRRGRCIGDSRISALRATRPFGENSRLAVKTARSIYTREAAAPGAVQHTVRILGDKRAIVTHHRPPIAVVVHVGDLRLDAVVWQPAINRRSLPCARPFACTTCGTKGSYFFPGSSAVYLPHEVRDAVVKAAKK